MRVFVVAFVLVAAVLLPASAGQGAVRVTWPAATEVTAGETVTVTVRASRAVRVALLRPASGGVPAGVVLARRMRRGTFRVAVPEGRHLLVVGKGARRLERVVTGLAPPPVDPCASQGPAAAVMEGDRTSVRPGELVAFTVRNTGTTCLGYGADYSLQRSRDGAWEQAGEPLAFPAWGATLLPGDSYSDSAAIPRDFAPGRYRVVKRVGSIDTAHEFDVVAG